MHMENTVELDLMHNVMVFSLGRYHLKKVKTPELSMH